MDSKNVLLVIDKNVWLGKSTQRYQLKFFKDHVEEIGIAGFDNFENILTSIKYQDVKGINFKRDWNQFFLKYPLYFTLKNGKIEKLGGGSGLTLIEAKKAQEIVTASLKLS